MPRNTITLDIDSLTLAEMATAEEQSGRSFDRLLTSGAATRRLLALWVHEPRSSERPRNWKELGNLRLADASSSASPSVPDGPLAKSAD
jgi:hypothetical protein